MIALGLRGTGAASSKDGLDAIKPAVDQINGRGGMLGRNPVRLFVNETETNPETALQKGSEGSFPMEINGPESWRPKQEIPEARTGLLQKGKK